MNPQNETRDALSADSALRIAAKAALAALSQNATFPADIAAARKWLADALANEAEIVYEPSAAEQRAMGVSPQ